MKRLGCDGELHVVTVMPRHDTHSMGVYPGVVRIGASNNSVA